MKFYISSSCHNEKNLFKNIQDLVNFNVENVELSAPHNYLSMQELKNTLNYFSKINFITHNFFPPQNDDFVMNLASNDKQILYKSEKLIDNTVTISKSIGSNIYGFHPGYLFDAVHSNKKFIFSKDGISYYEAEKNSIKFVKKILNKYSNFFFLAENLFPDNDRETSIFCTPDQISSYFSQFNQDNLGLLLDLGHLYITAKNNNKDVFKYLDNILSKHLNKIREVHLSENNGITDQHLSLKKDSWQFEALKIISTRIKKNLDINNLIVCLETRNSKIYETLDNLKYLHNAYY